MSRKETKDGWARFRSDGRSWSAARGTLIRDGHANSTTVSIIDDGFGIEFIEKNGAVAATRVVGPGDLIGLGQNIGKPCPVRVVAITAVRGIHLSPRSFELALEKAAVVLFAEVVRANRFLAEAALVSTNAFIPQRCAWWLLQIGDRMGEDLVPITHDLLSQMVGANRPAVTSALKSFVDHGLIGQARSSIRILDRKALAAEAAAYYF